MASPGLLHRLRRLAARLTSRLLLVNLALVAVPIAGFFYFGIHGYLGVYERQLLEAQESSMAQQARVLAAALSDRGSLEAEEAARILESLEQRLTARLRVLDRDGALLADSSRLGPRRDELRATTESVGSTPPREGWLYRLGSAPFRLWRRLAGGADGAPDAGRRPDDPGQSPEVRAALVGRYGTAVRQTPGDERSLTLSIAVPVENDGRVVGAVLASQSTIRVLQALDQVRLAIFKVFLISLGAAVALSLALAATIARPVRRLRREAAELLDRRGRLRGTFSGSAQLDEIGDLSRSLEGLSRRLEERIRFIEAFAADVSHELKNPLTSIRAATEMLAEVDSPAERRRFLAMVESEVARIERLLGAVREISVIDSRLEEEATERVDLAALVEQLVASRRLARPEGAPVELETPGEPVPVAGQADRLAQVAENLLDNAASFSPADVPVRVRLAVERRGTDAGQAVLSVSDRGPGIPAEHLGRIFDRFFTYRPSEPEARRHHTGLGLSIVRTIVEGHGGTVEAENRSAGEGGGARFTVRLPLGPLEER